MPSSKTVKKTPKDATPKGYIYLPGGNYVGIPMIGVHGFTTPLAPPLRDGPPAALFGATATVVLLPVAFEDARFLTPGYPPLPKLPPDFL